MPTAWGSIALALLAVGDRLRRSHGRSDAQYPAHQRTEHCVPMMTGGLESH
jgi:hypothetical protein